MVRLIARRRVSRWVPHRDSAPGNPPSLLPAHRAFVSGEPQPSAVVARAPRHLGVVVDQQELHRLLVHREQAPVESGGAHATCRHALECPIDEPCLFFPLVGVDDVLSAFAHFRRCHGVRIDDERPRDAVPQLVREEGDEPGDRLLVPTDDDELRTGSLHQLLGGTGRLAEVALVELLRTFVGAVLFEHVASRGAPLTNAMVGARRLFELLHEELVDPGSGAVDDHDAVTVSFIERGEKRS